MNNRFYKNYISKFNHIIGGSTAISFQCKTFRSVNDLDIMMSQSDIKELISETENLNIFAVKQSKYSKNYFICSLVFNDGSKIDLIDPGKSLSNFTVNIVDNISYLSLSDICYFKVQLLNNGDNNENNKHFKDLLFLISNGFVELVSNPVKYLDLPF